MVDGPGPIPDSLAEVFFTASLLILLGLALVFTGLDAQVEYAVTSPSDYLGFSSGGNDSSIVFSKDQLDGLNFGSESRVGYDVIGDEIGYCAGIRDNRDVYNLRVADGFSSTSIDSVTFSCGLPRSLTIHTQPDFTEGFSDEDLDYRGEFRPEVSCIQFSSVSVSPVSGVVGGLNCIDTESGDTVVPVVE